ncbi:MAG: carboxypeptidase regulatory-like domain-containing protein [Planctomycetes bacterium]|nr:carboxypeptidase regulatory-like domain-containing protein [Planctomycetota bacterium]
MKSLLVVLVCLGVLGIAWFLFQAPPTKIPSIPVESGPAVDSAGAISTSGPATSSAVDATGVKSVREELVAKGKETDPVILAALAGFRGQLVTEEGQPLSGKRVRFLRLDLEAVAMPYVFAPDLPQMEPNVEMYEATSGSDGTFEVRGVWPQVIYVMVADQGGDSQLTRVVERTPGPGEVIDLGRIVLQALGTIVGRIENEDGEPVRGALVHALNLPGPAFDAVPLERFDPHGGMIIREGGTTVVATFPPTVKRLYDMLPLPVAQSDDKGAFELRGVQPGDNVVVINKRGLQPLVKKALRVKSGAEKDAGTLRMREGEIVRGKVVDSAGQPIAGAQVLLANKSLIAPVHFASYAKPTDAKGNFSLTGMSPGQVFVAVRRSDKDGWTTRGPESVNADLEIKLAARRTLTIRFRPEAGAVPEKVDMRMIGVKGGNGPPVFDLALSGMLPWINLDGRITRLDDGRFRITDLDAGDYALAVKAPGFAAAKHELTLDSDAEVEIALIPAITAKVQVVDEAGKPVRNASIYVELRGKKRSERVQQAPIAVGRTDEGGELLVENAQRGGARLSASHPAYGFYHLQVELPSAQPIVFRVFKAGWLEGTLLDKGKPVLPGKHTLLVMRHWQETRGALEVPPRMSTSGAEGAFRVNGLAPGRYWVQAIPSIGLLGTPGGIAEMAMGRHRHVEMQEVVIESGRGSTLEFDLSGKRKITGPSARISGTVLLNGRPGAGLMVQGWGQNQLNADVDEAGRFDLGQVEVGHFNISLRYGESAKVEPGRRETVFWSRSGKVEEGKDLVFDIVIDTGSIRGQVVDSSGRPAAGIQLRAVSQVIPKPGQQPQPGGASQKVTSDANGEFHFQEVATGKYVVKAENNGFGRSSQFEVQAGAPTAGVRVELQTVYKVEGSIDLSVYPKQPEYLYIHLQGPVARGNYRRIDKDGKFQLENMPAGSYRMQIYCWSSEIDNKFRNGYAPQKIEVRGDMKDVRIVPVFVNPESKRK